MPRLIALSAAGDVLITQADGRFWLHDEIGQDDPTPLDAEQVQVHIDRGGLTVVDQQYPTWDDLELAVEQQVATLPEVEPDDPATWSVEDIREMLEEIDDLTEDGELREALESVRLLVALAAAQADPELAGELLARMLGLTEALLDGSPHRAIAPLADDPLSTRARHQYQVALAA